MDSLQTGKLQELSIYFITWDILSLIRFESNSNMPVSQGINYSAGHMGTK